MLRFRQKIIIAVFILLSLSLNAFAETGLKEKTNINLVELFKVKTHAIDHIKGLEAKLLATNEAEQENLLVELAQSLLYYQDRHNKGQDSNGATSKKGSSSNVGSFNVNGASGKVLKAPYSTSKVYRKALNAYKKAAKLSLGKSRIKYTRELSELAVKLQKKDELMQIFDEILLHGGDESGTYLAHLDYADGLAKLKDSTAETQFSSAVNMRTSVDGVEANYRYAQYLFGKKRFRETLNILDKFTFDDRQMYVHIALLRQKTMHVMNMNTEKVDIEIEQLRINMSNNPFIGVIPKLKGLTHNSMNIFDLPIAYGFNFIHSNEVDDSRGNSGYLWLNSPQKFAFLKILINASEVVYNEARGQSQLSRYAVAWAIRNRTTIDMNGCDFYSGAKGHPKVSECIAATIPVNPKGFKPSAFNWIRRYSCAVHGGTSTVGGINFEMNDSHVDISALESSGLIWEMAYVMAGSIPDPTGQRPFLPAKGHSGNPDGAQEWRKYNYCPENHSCKARLGNVGGNSSDRRICSKREMYSTDLFFWGRKPNSLELAKFDD